MKQSFSSLHNRQCRTVIPKGKRFRWAQLSIGSFKATAQEIEFRQAKEARICEDKTPKKMVLNRGRALVICRGIPSGLWLSTGVWVHEGKLLKAGRELLERSGLKDYQSSFWAGNIFCHNNQFGKPRNTWDIGLSLQKISKDVIN